MNQQAGFNLIELCICMSIIIILSGSCYYGYQQHHHLLERKQAELYLEDIALSLQEHADQNSGYAQLTLERLGFNNTQEDYTYRLTTSTNSFMISAEPSFQDNCGTLALDDKDTQTSTNQNQECW
jgi:Tfp pilus assembly protein PilE